MSILRRFFDLKPLQENPVVDEVVKMTKSGGLVWSPYCDFSERYTGELKGREIWFYPTWSVPYPFGAIVIEPKGESLWIRLSRRQQEELRGFLESRTKRALQEMFPNASK